MARQQASAIGRTRDIADRNEGSKLGSEPWWPLPFAQRAVLNPDLSDCWTGPGDECSGPQGPIPLIEHLLDLSAIRDSAVAARAANKKLGLCLPRILGRIVLYLGFRTMRMG